MKCSKCDREATKRLSPDLDIAGAPVCDGCESLVRIEIMKYTLELQNKNDEK